MSSNGNVAIVTALFEAFRRGDMDAILAFLDDAIVWETPFPRAIVPHGGKRTGKAEVRTFFETLVGTTELTRFEPQEFIASENVVAVLGVDGGTVRSTGRSSEGRFAMIFRIRDQKIVAFEEFADTHAVVQSWIPEITP